MDDQEIAVQLQDGPLEAVADKLIETVLERGAPDNVTLIITKLL
jgi:serine/threonine protein phosphatase PrpC